MVLPASRINVTSLAADLSAALKAKFGGAELVVGIDDDGVDVYLDAKVIAEKKLDGAAVRRAAADFLRVQPNVAMAVARDDLFGANPASGYLPTLQKGFHPDGSGDVLFLARPFTVVDREATGTNHATPYAYDAYVPAMFAGRGIKPGQFSGEIDATDLAPTIAALLEMTPPAQSEGKARTEIFAPRGGGAAVAPAGGLPAGSR